MRTLPTLLTFAFAGVCLSACGHTAQHASSTANASLKNTSAQGVNPAFGSANYRKVDADRDNDLTAPYDDREHRAILSAGHDADPVDRRAIVSLIRRYYKAVADANGAAGCAMIYSTLAEAVPEDYGQSPPGPPFARGKSCPVVMSKIYAYSHAQYAEEFSKLKIASVRLEEHHGFALLKFGTLPERTIYFKREGHTWKIESLLDRELP